MHIATSSFASLILKYSTVHKPGLSPGPSPARPEPSPRAGIFISTSLSPQSRAQARVFEPGPALHNTKYYWSGNPITILSYIGNGPYIAVNSSCYMSESCFLLELEIERVG